MTTETNNPDRPVVATACITLGTISLVIGGLIFGVGLIFFVIEKPPSDEAQWMGAAVLLMLSSALWFALGRIIILLAQIAKKP
jgi:hypothetical protein